MTQHETHFYWDGYFKIEFCPQCGKESSELVGDCVPLVYQKDEIELKNKLTDLGNLLKKQALNDPIQSQKRKF